MSLATVLSCSECGTPSYKRGDHSFVECEHCGNKANVPDFSQLDDGEFLVFDDDGYLCVDMALDFSPCDCTSLTICSRHEV